MRKLHIATTPSISKAALLELEIQLEKAKTCKLPAEAEAALLLRIRQGDASAVPLLVNSWEVHILSVVHQHVSSTARIADLVAIARQALTRLAENELAATNREHFYRLGNWPIRQIILGTLGGTQLIEETLPQPDAVTNETLAAQVIFIDKLNCLLHQVEMKLAAAITQRLLQLHDEIQAITSYDEEVTTEASVCWYLVNETNPVHTYWLLFRYSRTILKKDFSPLLSRDFVDYRKANLPQLSQPYCYLLYHLLERARPRIYSLISSIAIIRVQVQDGDEWMVEVG